MTDFLDDLKSNVSVRLLDPLGKSIEGLKYHIREGQKIVAKGVTDAEGNISSFMSKLGAELTVHVEHFTTGEMKQVKTLKPWSENYRVKLVSGKIKKNVVAKKDQGAPGAYKRKTYIIKKGDTLSKIAVQAGTSAGALAQLNGLKLTDIIYEGQTLKLPPEKRAASGQANTKAAPSPANPPARSESNVPGAAGPTAATPAVPEKSAEEKAEDGVSASPSPGNGTAPPDSTTIDNKASQVGSDVDGAPAKGAATDATALGPTSPVEQAPAPEKTADSPAVGQGASSTAKDAKGPASKVIPIVSPAATTVEEARGENGTPKVTVKAGCDKSQCLQKGMKSDLIEEINIRLSGFGGTIQAGKDWNEFSDATERAVKRFQKDYMSVPETGRACAAVLRKIDEFGTKYKADITKMGCKQSCVCQGFGRGKPDSGCEGILLNGKTIHEKERPGMHRALLWSWKAAQFYMTVIEKEHGYTFYYISSAYRCWHDNSVQSPVRTSYNHMGNALDIHFKNKEGHEVRGEEMDTVREIIFKRHLNAQMRWAEPNRISLEPLRWSATKHAAWSWVHFDVRTYQSKYKLDRHYAVTQQAVDGKLLMDMAKDKSLFSLINCDGLSTPSTTNGTEAGSSSGSKLDKKSEQPKSQTPAKLPAKNTPVKETVKPTNPTTVPVESGPKTAGPAKVLGARKPFESLSLSAQGLEFICTHEGYREFPYDDSKGFATIGYGHLIDGKQSCKTLKANGSKQYLKYAGGLKKPAAKEIMETDVERVIKTLSASVDVDLYQHEYDALVSLAFNCGGISKFEKLCTKLNKRDYAGCCSEFHDITNGGTPGLVTRRKAEMKMFTNAVYVTNAVKDNSLTSVVPRSTLGPLNSGLKALSNTYMLEHLGKPRETFSTDCKPVTNATLKKNIKTASVGPFSVTGLAPAVDSLRLVMADIKTAHPEVYKALGSAGMLCCRYVRGSTTSISNHSWGTAVDLTINGVLDKRGDGKVQRGLALIAPIFNKHGWYWGAGFPTEDAMHFEIGRDLLASFVPDLKK